MDPSQDTQVVYHYCSISALFGILKSKTFRLTNIRYMNDSMELGWLYDFARRIVHSELSKSKKEIDCQLAVQLLDRFRFPALDDTFFPNIFCGCFSRDGDSLSQWRAYADDGQGVAVGFKRSWLESFNKDDVRIVNVEYDETKVSQFVENQLEQVREKLITKSKEGPILPDMVSLVARQLEIAFDEKAPQIKNPAFAEEKETRIVAIPRRTELLGTSPTCSISELDFYVKDSAIVPYFPLPIEEQKTPIREIVLGPRNHAEHNINALMLLSISCGIPLARDQFRKSTATYHRSFEQSVRASELDSPW